MQQSIIPLQVDIVKFGQTVIKDPGSKRITAQRRICRIYIAGLKTQQKQMDQPDHQRGDQQHQGAIAYGAIFEQKR
jgi:hypothetical protein